MARPHDPRAVGRDPDPRFTLANERTYLAWNRTALALIGGGLAAAAAAGLDVRSRAAGRRAAADRFRLRCALMSTPLEARARAAPRRALRRRRAAADPAAGRRQLDPHLGDIDLAALRVGP